MYKIFRYPLRYSFRMKFYFICLVVFKLKTANGTILGDLYLVPGCHEITLKNDIYMKRNKKVLIF